MAQNSETIRSLIRLFETMNIDAALDYFTDDASYRFANYPPAVGHANIRLAATSSHMDAIKGCTFDIVGVWEWDDVVVCEMSINYIKMDDSILTLPCTDVFRMADGKIKDMRIYMDATPLFAH